MKKRPVVIWGFRSDYESLAEGRSIPSHAFIHAGYHRAFKAMGHETLWFDDRAEMVDLIPRDAIVFCMNTRGDNIPKRSDLFYIGHNLEPHQTADIATSHRIGLQYWFSGCPGERLSSYATWEAESRTLFQPWATDLLPEEIGNQVYAPRSKAVYWVGSVWDDGGMGNVSEINTLRHRLSEYSIDLRVVRATDQKHAEYIRKSVFAPSMQGAWQVNKGYIPCRALKNASYGQLVVTNNPVVHELFYGECAFGSTVVEMVDAAVACCCAARDKFTRSAMNLVRAEHTYVHRVKKLLEYVG